MPGYDLRQPAAGISQLQEEEVLMGTQSVALAGLQLLLAAHAEGLGGTWICWPLFAPEETRQALGFALHLGAAGLLFFGVPSRTARCTGQGTKGRNNPLDLEQIQKI